MSSKKARAEGCGAGRLEQRDVRGFLVSVLMTPGLGRALLAPMGTEARGRLGCTCRLARDAVDGDWLRFSRDVAGIDAKRRLSGSAVTDAERNTEVKAAVSHALRATACRWQHCTEDTVVADTTSGFAGIPAHRHTEMGAASIVRAFAAAARLQLQPAHPGCHTEQSRGGDMGAHCISNYLPRAVVHGGTCEGRHLNDVMVATLRVGSEAAAVTWWKPTVVGDAPAARHSHTLSQLGLTSSALVAVSEAPEVGGSSSAGTLFCSSESGRAQFALSPPDRASTGDAGLLFLFGGQTGHGLYTNDCYLLDPAAWRWLSIEATGEAPSPRCSHAAATVPGKARVVVYGGFGRDDGGKLTALNSIFVFDGLSVSWSRVGCPAEHRPICGLAMKFSVDGRQLHLFGGFNGISDCGHATEDWNYDGVRTSFVSGRRVRKAATPGAGHAVLTARTEAAVAEIGMCGRVLLIGGHSTCALGDVWIWDELGSADCSGRWRLLSVKNASLFKRRCGMVCVPFVEECAAVFVFGGEVSDRGVAAEHLGDALVLRLL